MAMYEPGTFDLQVGTWMSDTVDTMSRCGLLAFVHLVTTAQVHSDKLPLPSCAHAGAAHLAMCTMHL